MTIADDRCEIMAQLSTHVIRVVLESEFMCKKKININSPINRQVGGIIINFARVFNITMQ